MKKLALALAVVMIFSLAFSGCGPKTENPSGTDATTPSTDNQPAGSELAVCIGPDPETIDRPVALGVDERVEALVPLVEQLGGVEAVEAQQPVRLVKPVLPQKRRPGVEGGQQRVLLHRHVR